MPSPSKRTAKALPPDVKAALLAATARPGCNQRTVATELGYSSAVVSQALHDSYCGDVATLEQRIRGKYMAETVQCPVMGRLGRDHCLTYQKRPLAFTNPTRVALHKACKTCPNRKEAS